MRVSVAKLSGRWPMYLIVHEFWVLIMCSIVLSRY